MPPMDPEEDGAQGLSVDTYPSLAQNPFWDSHGLITLRAMFVYVLKHHSGVLFMFSSKILASKRSYLAVPD
ncbi:MAG: hypothetical protein B9J98_06275 [Candidatus Terraquivivens tikiterensis]|uniref:Uncharacterized protein n=1 Tax=Candidatus Terraquivivens tikiterensis TaxID=1980982 RepID=A0A2R7Y1N5_9ARCH|nr:MAG: hypothetical protein B9J98_06275 [Candidatus Terraquivivens tikiterensis]